MSKNRGLGRGFDSLIPTELDVSMAPATAASGDSVIEVEIGKISPNPHQPRISFNQEELSELAASIKQHGILQPLVVEDVGSGRYELIAGERRLRAAKLAGLPKVPVIVRSFGQQQKLELALIENLQRSDLNPVESAIAYKKLGSEFNLTLDQIGERVGKAKSTVSNAIRLLQLPRPVLEAIAGGQLFEAHGRALLAVDDASLQNQLLSEVINKKLTVRQTEDLVRQYQSKEVDDNTKSRPGRRPKNIDHLLPFGQEISRYLDAKVTIQPKSEGGRLMIDFSNDQELKEIAAKIKS